VNRQAFGLPEDRRHERIELANMNSIIAFKDGRRLPAIIVDCSISGAALDCGEMVPLGTDVTIGHREARVVRHFEGGIAVEFVQPISGEVHRARMLERLGVRRVAEAIRLWVLATLA